MRHQISYLAEARGKDYKPHYTKNYGASGRSYYPKMWCFSRVRLALTIFFSILDLSTTKSAPPNRGQEHKQ